MLQTTLVYSILSIFFIVLFYFQSRKKNGYIYGYIATLIFSCVIGMRYGVGVDYLTYKEIYDIYQNYQSISYSRLEAGFILIMKLCTSMKLHYTVFFGIFAFFQVFFLFKAFKNKSYLYPYLAYTFMIGCIWYDYCNIIRQALAFCIFVFAIQYILKKDFIRYVIIILLASTVHLSSIVFLLAYPLFVKKQEWIKSLGVQYILLSIALILSQINIIDPLFNYISPYLDILNYSGYLDADQEKINDKVSIGLGFVNVLFLQLIQISYSNKIKQYFQDPWLNIVYNIFYIGVLWKYVFLNSQLFSRFNYYLLGFQFIVGAYTLCYLYKKSKLMFFILALSYFLIFLSFIIDSENTYFKYYFFWQAKSFIIPTL